MRCLPIEVLSFEQKLEPSASSFKYLGSRNKTKLEKCKSHFFFKGTLQTLEGCQNMNIFEYSIIRILGTEY